MPASNPLSTTTFAAPVGKFDAQVKLASTAGLAAGSRLYADRELMAVVSLAGFANLANVRRGVDGTSAERHGTDVTVYSGSADSFFMHDPQGQPPDALMVSPHINILTGDVWFAQGDGNMDTLGTRYWVKQSSAHTVGALGVTPASATPTSST